MLAALALNSAPWLKGALTLIIYLAAAGLSLSWPSSVNGVSHLYLAAGFGLACVITWGRWMVVPVGIGSALVAVAWTAWCTPGTLAWTQTIELSLVSGVGAAAQVWLGAQLTQGSRRRSPMPLDSIRSIARFFLLAGPLACLTNAGLSTATMVYIGIIPASSWLTVGGTWWVGDTMGVLLGAPMLLALIGLPRPLWRQRRKIVGIPLLIATLLMGWGVGLVQQWEHDRAVLEFRRQAEATAANLRTQMHDYVGTLETLRGLFEASQDVTRGEFQHASAHWLNQQPGVLALGWSEKISSDQLTVFEQQVRSEGLRQFEVFDLPGKARTRTDALVVRYIEPMSRNHKALGYNMLSSAAARDAFEQALASDAPISTLPTTAWQQNSSDTSQGVVIYRTVRTPASAELMLTPATSSTKGAVFLALRLDEALQTMMREAPAFMQACLKDITDGRTQVLAGREGCRHLQQAAGTSSKLASAFGQHVFSHEVMLPMFAQQQWVLTLSADQATGLGDWTLMAALFSLGGVTLAAAMGSLLLMVTGHTARLNTAMTEARQQRQAAEEASNAKSEFLSRMSHELRTPLNAMLGFAQVMELDREFHLHDAQRSRLDQIQQAGWHLLDMIDDVLDISSIDTGAMPLQKEPVSVAAALSICMETVEALRQKHQVTITVKNLLKDQWGVMADPTRLQQVLSNLLSNAIKYNKTGGSVHVLVSVVQQAPATSNALAPPMVLLTVTDTGQGMSGEQLTQLFQPFNRLGRARGVAAGMGIGLSISRHLTQLMGGTLEATSKPGDGSVFSLSLPATPMPKPIAPQETNSIANPSTFPDPVPGQKHILYVEDNAVNSAVMQATLRERPSISLQIAGTIEAGLATLHDRMRGPRPDLILLDVHLPDASGLELLSLLKANPDTQDIPVVMISADAMPEQIDACLKAGAACYLTKPIQVRVLLQQIDDLL